MHTNRLANQKSPYLLQHAHNPVDWFPWGPEAFEKARREDKPIFLSIGYSTCHWCHVMERESFENENVAELLATIKKMLPVSPALMSPDEYTDQTERMLAGEIVREKIFLTMRQEIPFSTEVRVEVFEDDALRKLRKIRATVVVERESHKGMLIGAGGRMLKEIGTAARVELERLFPPKVFLELHVKVKPNWRDDRSVVSELDYREEGSRR